MTEYRVFLGNPGVGKSTLVNCMLGRFVFDSGISIGAGLTKLHQEYVAEDGIVYMDTPGLADITIRREAAEEIEKALRKGGKYKLFFVATLRNGRVSPEDITTFNQVVKAIDVPDLEFSVIINNVKPKQYKMITENEENLQKIFVAVNAMDVKTTSIRFMPVLKGLDEEENAVVPLPKNFVEFLNSAPTVNIPRERVNDIDLDAERFARLLANMERLLKELQEDNNALRARLEELERRKPGFLQSVANAVSAAAEELSWWNIKSWFKKS